MNQGRTNNVVVTRPIEPNEPMLVVKVELHPLGDAAKAKTIATATIINDGSGTPILGNYNFMLYRQQTTAWQHGKIRGFLRKKLNAWDLLYRVLREAVGNRNK